jgi:Domain of unknown function (DUF4115)
VPNANPGEAQQFDEDAVLRDLEQLRGQILEARSRRERKAAEFDSFVKQARAASHAERLAAVEQVEATTRAQAAARSADRARVAPLPPPPSLAGTFSPSSSLPLPGPTPEITTPVSRRVMAPKRRRHVNRHPIVLTIKQHSRAAMGVAAGLALAVVIYSFSASDPATAPSEEAQAIQQGASPTAAPARATSAQPPARPDTRPVQIQLEAIRDVWMQVVADGRREIGRTVPKGQRLSFGANNEITLRAGDAGAVRVYVAGVDRGVLGGDGQVVNRRFTK